MAKDSGDDMTSDWRVTVPLDDLRREGRRVVRLGSQQIALFWHREQVFACDHRCPHEGYPLSQGTLSGECTLTCHWHNWKFDLADGRNVLGGDALRVYPTKLITEAEGATTVWVDVVEEAPEHRRARALERLSEALDDDDTSRLAREVVRYQAAGGDALDVVRWAVQSRAPRLEYGATHAFGALYDWLSLRELREPADEKLVCVLEPLAHIARDTLRYPEFPFTEDVVSGTGTELLNAFAQGIEDEDERRAIAAVRGALRRDVSLAELDLRSVAAPFRTTPTSGTA